MPVSPTYTCEICGVSSKKKTVPKLGPTDSEIPRCFICNIPLYNRCFQHGFCPSHWTQLPPNLQEPLEKINRNVEKRRKEGDLCLILMIPLIIYDLYLMTTWKGDDPFMKVILAIALFASIGIGAGFYTLGDFPIQNLRRREQRFLTPYKTTLKMGSIPQIPKRSCSNCGALIPENIMFCKNCGAKILE